MSLGMNCILRRFALFLFLILPFQFAFAQEQATAEDSAGIPVEWKRAQEAEDKELPQIPDGDDMVVTGSDIRVLLAKIVPDLDAYTLKLIDQIEGIWIRNQYGELYVEVRFTQPQSVLPIRAYKKTRRGEPYEVRFDKVFSFYLVSKRDTIWIHDIEGITLMVRLPVLPDGIAPRDLFLDSSRDLIQVSALALHKHLEVYGSLSVRYKKFNGIDWKQTLSKNWKLIFSILRFVNG